MKEVCIFKVKYSGDLWKVVVSSKCDKFGLYQYRIMYNRRVMEKLRRATGKSAIELCMNYAMGCDVDIKWGEIL